MAKSRLLSLGICLFILFHGCLAVRPYNSHQGQGWSTRPDHQSRGEQSECQINNLDALSGYYPAQGPLLTCLSQST
uniref:Uncharacterized protein n=1 Tax=Nelumbo nucifera TaxID=4432 RepID=A0A822XQZ5_NELNU|nr:TPA_asm: hypothetical protein HUJ06_021361 [Nelumbo nucifera]